MFVTRFKSPTPGRKYFRVIESYREGGEVRKRFIVNLGKHSTVQAAYLAELAKYLRASDKLERLEYVMLPMQGKGRIEGGLVRITRMGGT